ncbi:DUF4397 domain-containing protein [Deinococcus pimensis]|uniref:DUF4397 domain-containing protein n=1 Tax=Deinococcus pimensis TaxID=309888 RepID=UPI0004AF7458|nr:DUF4397 domain-containing protein [Deinococcus pimensis]
MRHLKALAAALALTSAVTANAAPQDEARVHFLNHTGAAGVVDVYVDGQLLFDDMFSGAPSMFARTLTAGEHTVVVTPHDAPLGQRDLARGTVDVTNGMAYTLSVAQSAGGALYVDFTSGTPGGQ